MNNPYPSLPVALVAASLALPGLAQRVPDTRVDHAPAGVRSSNPRVAAAGADVYVTWEDSRNGLRDVFVNYSRNAGETWQATDVRINTSTGTFGSGDPHIAVAGASVYVAYNGDGGVRFNRSLDAGETWLGADVLLAPLGSTYPTIAASGATVYVVYRQTVAFPFHNDLYFRRSLDSGASWSMAVRLDTDGQGAGNSTDQRIAVAGSTVCVAWRDQRAGLADVYFNRSLDGGGTWLPADVRINTGVPPGTSDAFHNVEIAASGSTVYVLWWDDRNAPGGVRDVFVKRSLDSGTTWPAAPTRLDTDAPGAAESHFPHIAVAGASAWVVWSEFRNGVPDIYMNRTADHGTTWLAADVRIDHAPAGAASGVTQIAASGSAVHVTFQDDRAGPLGLFANRSLDGGITWLPRDLPLRTTPGPLTSHLQDMAVAGDAIYVVWDDARSGNDDIYFNIPFGFQQYGTGKAGSGGRTPVLSGGGAAAIGNTVSIDVSNGLGGAAAVLIIGGPGSRTSIPFFGGTVLLLPQVQLPVTLGGAIGIPGAGQLSLPLAIPLDPVLVGSDVYFQPIILDAGASFGLSFGNAIQMWVG